MSAQVTLTEAEREQLSTWDNRFYSCACDDGCPSLPCQNERDDIYVTVERIVAARMAQAWDEGYSAASENQARLLYDDGPQITNPYREKGETCG